MTQYPNTVSKRDFLLEYTYTTVVPVRREGNEIGTTRLTWHKDDSSSGNFTYHRK